MRAPFSSLTPPPKKTTTKTTTTKKTWDRHKHLQGTNIDIELVCVCLWMCMHLCVGLGVCACVCVCVCSCCMHWILTICTSNFHSIKRMNPLVSDETGSPTPPPNPFFIFNTPFFFLFVFCKMKFPCIPCDFHEIWTPVKHSTEFSNSYRLLWGLLTCRQNYSTLLQVNKKTDMGPFIVH